MTRPNVVFVMSDQHRWDFMGYETSRLRRDDPGFVGRAGVTLTPNLDAFAEAGVAFRSARCTSPLCSPSRAAIASGQYAVSSGCFTNLHELPPGTAGFVSQLRGAGYRTGAVGKTHMEIHAYDSDLTSLRHRTYMDSLGWDGVLEVSGSGMLKTGIRCAYSEWLKREKMFEEVLAFYKRWRYFMDPAGALTGSGPRARARGGRLQEFECQEWPFDERFHETRFIGDEAVDWLERQAARGPFFLHVGFAAPHSPIEPLPRFMELYRGRDEPLPRGVASCEARLLDGRRGYRAMISEIDEQVGRIRERLDKFGLVDNTVFVYTADHGDMAGDHGLTGKVCFFEGSVRVPLIVSGPGVTGGRHSSALVELIDLGRTICELCGVRPHSRDQGRSLVPVLRGERETHRDTVYAEMGCDRMIFDGTHKLMWGDPLLDTRKLGRLHLDKPVNIPPSPPRLYDLERDPHELRDLVNDPSSQPLIEALVHRLGTPTLEHVKTQPNKPRGEYRPL